MSREHVYTAVPACLASAQAGYGDQVDRSRTGKKPRDWGPFTPLPNPNHVEDRRG